MSRFIDNSDKNKMNAMIRALDNTGVRMFMYYPQTKSIAVPEKTCAEYHCKPIYEDMPDSFARDYVHEDDYSQFNEMYYRIDAGEKIASAVFHDKDLKFRNHVTLTTVTWTEDGRPDEVFGLIENESDQFKSEVLAAQLEHKLEQVNASDDTKEALMTMASSIASQYFAVYYIWLEEHRYICFQENLPGILSVIGEKGNYEEAWDKYITNYIEEKDQQNVRDFIEINTLADRIGNRSSITITYKRKEIGWTRGQFIPGSRDESGRISTVIYTVTDINDEINNNIKRQEAERQALQDSLTKLWNRNAFEMYKSQRDFRDNQTGLLLFDIDRFKTINDNYGHEEGDKVIITVAEAVRDILRQKDIMFRMGGDEFAVLLYNCNKSVWHITCEKIATVHKNVKKLLPPEMNVTISAGLCVSEGGYQDEMYTLADKALYNTKANGRAGCSFIELDGEMVDEWHDQSGFLKKGDILEKNSTVTWMLQLPKNPDVPKRAYGDDLFRTFLGIGGSVSPEEAFEVWVERVEPGYLDVLRKCIDATIADGRAEAVYLWNHPDKGKVQLRCSSSFDMETEEYYTLIGYNHITKDMHVFTIEDIHSKVKDALEEMFFCNFYIRLNDYSFDVYKAQPYMLEMLASSQNAIDVIGLYIKYMVADENKEEMKKFLDLTTLKERLGDANLLEINYSDPAIGRSRAKFVAVERNKNGVAESVSLVVEAIT